MEHEQAELTGAAEAHAATQDASDPAGDAASLTDVAIRRRRPNAEAAPDLIGYWQQLRGSKRYPSARTLDRERVKQDWPSSLLMRCNDQRQLLALPFTDVGGLLPETTLTTMAVEWIRGLCAEAVRLGQPVETIDAFPSPEGSVRYRAAALPFSDDEATVDHVLFHIRRA